jgi:hypothetical protein
VAFVAVFAGTWYGGRYNSRGIAIIALIIPTLMGGALMAWLPSDNKSGLLAGNYLTNTVGASLPLLYSWVGANCRLSSALTPRISLWLIIDQMPDTPKRSP